MAGVTAQGATFSFNGFSAYVTGVSVETPQAEVTNMTDAAASPGHVVMVPTGEISGGAITVDYWHRGSVDTQTLVKTVGLLSFTSPQYSVSRRVILTQASTEARAGEIVRGTLRFQMTDYSGQ